MTAAALPSEEQARFDRSLRLWGAEAQQLLRSAHVVLLGATSTGCETLKNLALPGLGHFTIVDDKPVTRRDLGNNFFLEQEDEGRNRAEAVVAILNELNPMCGGLAVKESIAAFVGHGTSHLLGTVKATLVIASSDVPLGALTRLSAELVGTGVPLVYAATNGLLGVVRLQADPTFILYTMPGVNTKVADLRPLDPFPALQSFFARYDPSDANLDHHDYAHTPWFCVLHHALRKWRAARTDGKQLPTSAEWKEVKQLIETFARIDPVTKQKKLPDSFKEAQDNCSMRLDVSKRNTPELNEVLNDARAAAPSAADGVIWFLCHGLKRFREAHRGAMPLPGTIPDFECTTAMYRELQSIFRDEAAKNAQELAGYAREAMKQAGVDSTLLADENAAEFARQAWEINLVTFPSIAAEFTPAGNGHGGAPGLCPIRPAKFSNADTTGFRWYACHRAAMIYADRHGAVPAGRAKTADALSQPTDDAVAELAAILRAEVWPDAPLDELKDKELSEWVRYGGSEPITVASIVGAAASQECIKLIQKRRRPITHTLVYDGIENYFTTIGMNA
jgi:amyloid beta precursor protein binding protein 1